MAADRYVTLGLARVRARWFSDVTRWSTSGSLAMDFVKTVSVDEVRARLESGRPFSALLIDAGVPGIDRDLLELAKEQSCAVFVVDARSGRDWMALGAATTLSPDFDRAGLEGALLEHAAPIGAADELPGQTMMAPVGTGFRARTVAVTGPGGTGRSIVATAIAQGFAADVAHSDTVVLADLALHADQAMLHDARDVIPGILELVEGHRSGAPSPEEVRSLTFEIVERRYRLLLGLRRHRDWTALRPRSLHAALDGLRRAFTLVVADIDDDLEDETLTGSADIEDRNLLARTTLSLADVVVVVGVSGPKGVHSLLRVVRDCLGAGVRADRIVTVVNRMPKRGVVRAETTRTVTELLLASHPGESLLSPVFLPERRFLDEALRDVSSLPSALIDPVTSAVRARLDAVDRTTADPGEHDAPVPVEIGSLGVWDEEVAGVTVTDDPSTTPLQLIERAVLERAKDIRLDLDDDEARARLRTLVEDEVARWSGDFKRGLRAHDLADPDLVIERGYRNLVGYGPLESLLADDDVWEVMINAPDSIFVKRHFGTSGYHDEVFHDDDHVERTLTKILDDASGSHRKLDPTEGLQDAQLDDGARLHIVHSDVARGGHVMVNIRKFTGVAFREIEQLVERNMLTVQAAEFLRACARAKLTVVFAGAPGSGKTTIMSCTAAELDPSLRVVVAEEVFEADVPLPNVASMQTRAARADRPAVDLRRLVAGFLRMAPDVAIVGEVRDREALPLLLTLSSGVKGFTTIHAGSCRQALSRLRFICQLSDTSSEIPMSALNNLVSESIDIVVHCAREANGPRVTEILAVEDQASSIESTQFTVTELFTRPRADRPLEWSGTFPQRAARELEAAGYDLRDLLGAPEPAGPVERGLGSVTP